MAPHGAPQASAPSDGPAPHYRFRDQGRDASLAELEEFLADYTPERVSEISGVPVGQIQALAKTDQNQTRAARLLGLTRDALRYRMKKLGIQHPPHRPK